MEFSYTLTETFRSEALQREAELIEAAKENPVAFEPIYQHYRARIYHYLFLRIGCQEDAADLTQQVFLKALMALPDYRSRGIPFEAWLFRIASHAVQDTYRRKKTTISWDRLPEMEQLAGYPNPENIYLQRERLSRLQQLLGLLDSRKRELIALRFSAGLSSSEIALVVGKSPAAVKKQLTRILQSLKEQL
jgi:RNA polymerase sigma-70 factor (ECF subfamily)